MSTIKTIAGVILVIIGIWLLLPQTFFGKGMWEDLLLLIKGGLPILVIFIGLVIVWIETEEKRIKKNSPVVS